jgi:HlyD family secretion protein
MQQLSPAAKKDIDKLMAGKKLQDLSAEQRDKIFTKLREAAQGGGAEAKGGAKKGGKPEGITVGGFTEADRENAKLPLPPEEDSQLEVLLRPGLLADVEIIVEKITDAIHIPNQAVFERDGKQFVYVQNTKDNHFDERLIKLAKRSESVMVIADGLKPGETIALGDPTAKKKDKNEKSSGSSKPGVGMPSAGAAPTGKGK